MIRCLLLFHTRWDSNERREPIAVDLVCVPRAGDSIVLNSDGEEWWVDYVAHAPFEAGEEKVWVFLRGDRYEVIP